jgi:phosphopantothenoylcysteine decarboxylase/phosphopantothenate--cysteine ligase
LSIRALVTAGGTSEPIDDVRVITNRSTGRLGAAITDALVARGVEVTLLASNALADRPDWLDPRVQVHRFGSFDELQTALMGACGIPPDLLFMAAAVADYSPERQPGKIDSSAEHHTLMLRRNPKLLAGLRDLCGPQSLLVGFKLTSGLDPVRLHHLANDQIQNHRLNACVANDLSELTGENHPLWWVPSGGEPKRFLGSKRDTAVHLVEEALLLHGQAQGSLPKDRQR